MVNRSKQRGTAWESAIVAYLQERGWPHAERRALNGVRDRGDIAGLPGVVIEAKNTRDQALGSWINEANAEAANANCRIGVAWVHRRGKASAGDGYVVMDGHTFARLLKEAGW